MIHTLKRIRNIYSQNPNSATSLPNTKFIFPKQIFIIPCGPSLQMRPKARVLALISIMPNYNFAAIYSFGNIWPWWDSVVGYAKGAG
jgi:hypothetical protein